MIKRFSLLLIIIPLIGTFSYAQKYGGIGAELSVLSAKANYRSWVSKSSGFEIFGGVASELDDLKPNDPEAGLKYLHTLIYHRADKTYIGIVGKWKWVDVNDANRTTSLAVPGILIGKEWYDKRRHSKGLAIEVGYQFGHKEYNIYSPLNHIFIGKYEYNELPLILNLRYSFYRKR